ncbi:hypothetical protein AWI17_20325 [Enterobacter asburiae]|nr:hypothetical protein AWI17_20325 [Enterobacter asburiae]KVJ92382.1 hypothetical protein AWS24_11115 [Enterobacter asburiae]OEH17154.1 hypothetical protein AN693_0210730 [Enterobacter kobei]
MCLIGVGVQAEAVMMTTERTGVIFRYNAISAVGFGAETSDVSENVRDRESIKLIKLEQHCNNQAVLSDTAKTIRVRSPDHRM